ncbi:MAG TPA: AAA family ATPase [Candidatus Paceibacterota bacterium]
MNFFVCIEGVDCVGKTSVAELLASRVNAVYYKSPGGMYAKERKIVDGSIEPLRRYFFYRAATQYDSGIIGGLLKHSPVVCDRYIYSTFAMHAAMDEKIRSLFEITGLVMPDYVFLLTADEAIRRKRLAERFDATTLESNFLLQKKADELFKLQGHPTIDTTNTNVDEVVETILSRLREKGSI